MSAQSINVRPARGGDASPTKAKAPSPKFDRQKLSELLKTSALCLVQVEKEKIAALEKAALLETERDALLARVAELELELTVAAATTATAAAIIAPSDSIPLFTTDTPIRRKPSTPKSSTPKPKKDRAATFHDQEDFRRCIVELIETRLLNDNLRIELERRKRG